MSEEIEATFKDLQTQLTAVHAALEGKGQAGIFKPHSFSDLPSKDVTEWLRKFDQYAKFYTWNTAKKLGALSLLLNGSAQAWLHTQSPESQIHSILCFRTTIL